MNKWEKAQTLEPIHWLKNSEKYSDPVYLDNIFKRSRYVLKQLEFLKDIRTSDIGLEIGGGATPLLNHFPVAGKYFVDPLMDFYIATFPHIFCDTNSVYDNAKGESLPYQDETFDFLVSRNVLDHVEDVNICLKEMQRVMKPDAIAYIGMNVFAGPLFIYKDIFKDPEHPYTFSRSRFEKLISKYFDIKSVIVNNSINGDHFSEMEDKNPLKSLLRNIFIKTNGYSLLEFVVSKK
jgi:SAM-dependent methyltransferase